jgi:oxygen-independent coproporphyrinogen-3 oxidase
MKVNRLSMGVQSFDDVNLERLERRARRIDNVRSLELLRREWKGPWSLDLMFGLPKQTLSSWSEELEIALGFEPSHVSAYQLTLTTQRSKNWEQPPEDDLLALFDLTESRMESAGLERYEVSNFARPGFESRHNLKYWRLEPFLGLGPGASGLLSGSMVQGLLPASARYGVHQKNPDRFEKWLQKAGQREAEATFTQPRTASDHLFEMLMMGLRLREGVDIRRLGDLGAALPEGLRKIQAADFIDLSGGRLRATPKGLRILDSLLPKIFKFLEKDAPPNLDSAGIDPKFR